MLIFIFLTLTSYFTLVTSQVAAAPLKGHLLCSGCEVIVRELLSENKKQYRANDRFLGELEFTELQERVCRRGIRKYKLAQENSGGHFKVFADEDNKDDMQTIEPPTFYGDDSNYFGATGRLDSLCTEYMGNFEDDIKKLLDDRASEKQFRDRICIRLAKVCHRDVLEPYDKVEKEKRKLWRRMKRRETAQSEIGQSLAEELEHDETEEGKEMIRKGLPHEQFAKKRWAPSTEAEKEVEEKRQRKERREKEEKEQKENRKKALAEGRKRWEKEQAEKKALGKGRSFEEWKKEDEAQRNVDWGQEGKFLDDDAEEQLPKDLKEKIDGAPIEEVKQLLLRLESKKKIGDAVDNWFDHFPEDFIDRIKAYLRDRIALANQKPSGDRVTMAGEQRKEEGSGGPDIINEDRKEEGSGGGGPNNLDDEV